MRGDLVAVDLETTGLDPTSNEIIEVGAVRIRDGVIIDEYSSLVDPGKPIPPIVTYLTGIQRDDVMGAPTIDLVLPQIRDFVGSAPVIAHNIGLDMGFLQDRHRILTGNARIDTYELASVLLPRAPRYNLNSLTQQLEIDLDLAHRALDDARATAMLYWNLWQRALSLPHETLRTITNAASNVTWDCAVVFQAALKESTTASFDKTERSGFTAPLTAQTPAPVQIPSATAEALDPNEVVRIFAPGGALETQIQEYESRQQQMDMARAVTEAFNAHKHIIIEAGTGTGKSLAYLAPAILWALQNNERVVISTYTITLQEHLLRQDIPLLRETLNLDFMAATMKGRSHYLSPQRFELMRRWGPTTATEMRVFAKIVVWLLEDSSGDRNDISLRGPDENNIWDQLSADQVPDPAGEVDSPFAHAQRLAQSAQILIVNHALLVADALTDQPVLPDYQYVIIDEAHHLEDAITTGLTAQVDYSRLRRLLANLGTSERGILGEILQTIGRTGTEKDAKRFRHFISTVDEATRAMENHLGRLFGVVESWIEENRAGRPGYFNTIARVTPASRQTMRFSEIQNRWRRLGEFFEAVTEAVRHLTIAVQKLNAARSSGLAEIADHALGIADQLEVHRKQLDAFIMAAEPNRIDWLRAGQTGDNPTLYSAPLHVGQVLANALWDKKESAILTSATLRSADGFEFIKDRLQLPNVDSVNVGSPFNYRESTLIFLPTDIPEPNDRTAYQAAVERAIIELAAALNGRVMALFTSYAQIKQTSQTISPRLALGNITVFDQSDGTSRESLLDGFKTTEKAVLLGTRTFWEGIDIPGEALSGLVITRLPFMVPTDPIFSARSETYENAFDEFALPEAILRFRQGFGRLIRRKTDRGVVVIMDKRMTSKGYGAQFLDALPDCEIQQAPLSDLAKTAQNWLQR